MPSGPGSMLQPNPQVPFWTGTPQTAFATLTALALIAGTLDGTGAATGTLIVSAQMSATTAGAGAATGALLKRFAGTAAGVGSASAAPSVAATPDIVGAPGPVNATGGNTANTPSWDGGSPRTAGDLLVCFVAGFGGVNAPTLPGGWSIIESQGATSACRVVMYGKLAAGGDAAPTIAAISGINWTTMLAEFSGVDTSLLTGENHDYARGTTSPLTAAPVGADAAASDLVLACSAVIYTIGASKSTSDAINNGASTHDTQNGATVTDHHYGFAWGVTASNAVPSTNTWTFTTTNIINAITMVVTLKAASAAGGALLVSTPSGAGAQTGALGTSPLISATLGGVGALSGQPLMRLSAALSGTGAATGRMLAGLEASADGAGTATGVLTAISAAVSATLSGQGAASGVLLRRLSVTLAGAGQATGALHSQLVGSAAGRGAVRGSLTVPVLVAARLIPFTEIDVLDQDRNVIATVTASLSAFLATNEPSGDVLHMDGSCFGIDSAGNPYFDPSGATIGEASTVTYDPSLNRLALFR